MDRNFVVSPLPWAVDVALRKESVDRNLNVVFAFLRMAVALRKESVDRNYRPWCICCRPRVALRKESVDRNIGIQAKLIVAGYVALRKESVDRNLERFSTQLPFPLSLSARRAWIEIETPKKQASKRARRSPQGERG